MIKVWPIAVSMVNWHSLIKETAAITGHTVTKGLDNCKIKFSEHARQLISLMEFTNVSGTPSTILSQSDRVLGHLFFSFLIIAPAHDILNFIAQAKLEILVSKCNKKNHRLIYASGTLDEWKRSLDSSEIASTCLDFFYNIGLKSVFNERKLLK